MRKQGRGSSRAITPILTHGAKELEIGGSRPDGRDGEGAPPKGGKQNTRREGEQRREGPLGET